jgi:hypothetical protein
MHYDSISHCPTVGPAQTLCIMRFMHYERMHYEIVYCTTHPKFRSVELSVHCAHMFTMVLWVCLLRSKQETTIFIWPRSAQRRTRHMGPDTSLLAKTLKAAGLGIFSEFLMCIFMFSSNICTVAGTCSSVAFYYLTLSQ